MPAVQLCATRNSNNTCASSKDILYVTAKYDRDNLLQGDTDMRYPMNLPQRFSFIHPDFIRFSVESFNETDSFLFSSKKYTLLLFYKTDKS